MSHSSILGGTRPPQRPSGTSVNALGPSDSSDSGSDVQGEQPMATEPDNRGEWGALPSEKNSDTDAMGTGERASAAGSEPRDNADILPDHIVDPRSDPLKDGEVRSLATEDEDEDPVG